MSLDEHGKVVVSTHDVATLDEPATETQQETNEITQEESEETNQEKVIEITSQASNSINCSRNNHLKQPSDFDEQCASLKASTCDSANEILSSDVSQ